MYYICDVGASYVPIPCDPHIRKAIVDRNMLNAHDMYPNMPQRTGVLAKNATYEDFQRIFKCKALKRDDCNHRGLQFPRRCSHPPCDQCNVDYQSKLNKMPSKMLYNLFIY